MEDTWTREEFEELSGRILKKDGTYRKDASAEDIARYEQMEESNVRFRIPPTDEAQEPPMVPLSKGERAEKERLEKMCQGTDRYPPAPEMRRLGELRKRHAAYPTEDEH